MISWQDSIESFKGYLTLERSLSSLSVEAYARDVGKLASYAGGLEPPVLPVEATREVLEGFLGTLPGAGMSASSQARHVSSVRAFYKFLVYDGKVAASPAEGLESPKSPRRLPTVLTVEEVEALIGAVDAGKAEGARDRAIIETLYSCGLRVSELCGLRLSNVHFRSGVVKVEGKGNKERFVPLGERAREEIRAYVHSTRKGMVTAGRDADILFLGRGGARLSRVSVFNIVKHLTLRAGVNKVVSPHTLRHSFASHLVNGGADIRAVQDMLGHESILTTEVYTHLDSAFVRDAVVSHHPRARRGRKSGSTL